MRIMGLTKSVLANFCLFRETVQYLLHTELAKNAACWLSDLCAICELWV